MRYKADARMQAVARFREKVGDFAQRSAEDFRYLLQLLRDARAEIAGKVRAYEECVVSARGLLAQARGKKSAYANARAGLESELSRTDKTVSRTQRTENGGTKTTEEPNPQYAQLKQQADRAASQCAAASAVSEKVYQKLCGLEHDLEFLQADLRKAETCIGQAEALCRETEALNEGASSALERVVGALSDYLNVSPGK